MKHMNLVRMVSNNIKNKFSDLKTNTKNVCFIIFVSAVAIFTYKLLSEVAVKREREKHVLITNPRYSSTSPNTNSLVRYRARLSEVKNITELRKNVYISSLSYTHRKKTNYFSDYANSVWQAGAYFIIAELARRYQVKHIIDFGCGKSYKLSKMYPEFTPIGIDFKENLLYSKKQYPFIKFIELDMNMMKSCYIPIDKEVLKNSVVISSDVIEHVLNPLQCYMKLISFMAKYAKAVIVSTPDRFILYTRVVRMQENKGPPTNPAHVREWNLDELEIMMIDQDLIPVLAGFSCSKLLQCKTGFKPETNNMNTAVLLLQNTDIAKSLYEKQISSSIIRVIMVVHEGTKSDIVLQNLKHLKSHEVGADVTVFVPNKAQEYSQLSENAQIKTYFNIKDLTEQIRTIASKALPEDWFILTDAHEFLFPVRDTTMPNSTIKEVLLRIHQVSKEFNSAAITTVFLQDSAGNSFLNSDKPIRIFGPGVWYSTNSLLTFKPEVPVHDNRIRIWSGAVSDLQFKTLSTNVNQTCITEVTFSNRRIYPFGLYSQRVHPFRTNVADFNILNGKNFQQQYAYFLSMSYILEDKKQILTTQYYY